MTEAERKYKTASLRVRATASNLGQHMALKIDRDPTLQNLATIRSAQRMMEEVQAFLDRELNNA